MPRFAGPGTRHLLPGQPTSWFEHLDSTSTPTARRPCMCWDMTMPGAPQPVVEMLWEPHDPHETLRERFGFRAPASAGRWIAATVNTHWDAQIEAVERIVISHTNALAWLASSSGDRLIAKWSVATDTFASLSRVSRFTHWLHVNGLPVAAPLPSLAGCLQVETEKVSMCLQRVVEGDLLDVDDLDQVRAA